MKHRVSFDSLIVVTISFLILIASGCSNSTGSGATETLPYDATAYNTMPLPASAGKNIFANGIFYGGDSHTISGSLKQKKEFRYVFADKKIVLSKYNPTTNSYDEKEQYEYTFDANTRKIYIREASFLQDALSDIQQIKKIVSEAFAATTWCTVMRSLSEGYLNPTTESEAKTEAQNALVSKLHYTETEAADKLAHLSPSEFARFFATDPIETYNPAIYDKLDDSDYIADSIYAYSKNKIQTFGYSINTTPEDSPYLDPGINILTLTGCYDDAAGWYAQKNGKFSNYGISADSIHYTAKFCDGTDHIEIYYGDSKGYDGTLAFNSDKNKLSGTVVYKAEDGSKTRRNITVPVSCSGNGASTIVKLSIDGVDCSLSWMPYTEID